MSIPKLEIQKFTIGSDFPLWKMKMRALLVHQGLKYALDEDDSEGATSLVLDKKKSISNIGHIVPKS